jgi:hypothetical protein
MGRRQHPLPTSPVKFINESAFPFPKGKLSPIPLGIKKKKKKKKQIEVLCLKIDLTQYTVLWLIVPFKYIGHLPVNSSRQPIVWFGLVWFGLVWFGLVWFFETGFLCKALAVLELTL